jgi:hypothetical protein
MTRSQREIGTRILEDVMWRGQLEVGFLPVSPSWSCYVSAINISLRVRSFISAVLKGHGVTGNEE